MRAWAELLQILVGSSVYTLHQTKKTAHSLSPETNSCFPLWEVIHKEKKANCSNTFFTFLAVKSWIQLYAICNYAE